MVVWIHFENNHTPQWYWMLEFLLTYYCTIIFSIHCPSITLCGNGLLYDNNKFHHLAAPALCYFCMLFTSNISKQCTILHAGTLQALHWQSSPPCSPWQLYCSADAPAPPLRRHIFTVAGPRAWNALPSRLRSLARKDTFFRHLKTPFNQHFN